MFTWSLVLMANKHRSHSGFKTTAMRSGEGIGVPRLVNGNKLMQKKDTKHNKTLTSIWCEILIQLNPKKVLKVPDYVVIFYTRSY